MDNRYYENVIGEMKSFLDESGFKECEGGYANDTKKIKVEYNESNQTYSLLMANKDEEGNYGEFTTLNTWLFDDSQNAKDAASVGIDFVVSLRKELGIKIARKNTEVDLPSANKSGNMTVTGFAKKMLDVFPVIKEDYKTHVSVYGNFLYLNFFGEHLVPQMKNLFATGTKKQIKKLYDVFEDAYIKGDNDTVNVMIALLSACAYNDQKVKTAIEEMLSVDNHFLQAFNSFNVNFPKSKKIFNALVK